MLLSYLTIGEDSGIISLEAAFDELVDTAVVDALLLWVYVKHEVIGEGLVFSQQHLWLPRSDQCAHMTALNFLLGHLRTNPRRRWRRRKSMSQIISQITCLKFKFEKVRKINVIHYRLKDKTDIKSDVVDLHSLRTSRKLLKRFKMRDSFQTM